MAAAWAIDLLRERCGSWAQKNPLRPQQWSQQGVNVYGRHCRAPQRQGFIERYPRMSCESIIAAATAPTVTPASWLAVACAQRKNLSSSGRTATTISRDEMSNPLLVDSGAGLTPTGTRCCGCLMSAPLGSPGRRHSRRNGSAQTGFVDVARSRTGRVGRVGRRETINLYD